MIDQSLVSDMLPTLETLSFSPRLRLPVHTAKELIVTDSWVSESTSAEKVYRMFGQDPSLPGLAVLREERPVGQIFRSTLIERFSFRYSHELFGPKPITEFMDPRPVMVQVSSDIDEIGKRFQGDALKKTMDDGFLVVDGDRFVGIGTWQILMKCLSGRREELFSYMAHHDPLTGLPNRILFLSELERELAEGGRGAVLYLDMDRFKEVNDKYGHQEGDRLLNEFSDRLLLSVRSGDLVARLGGDEFGVLVRGLSQNSEIPLWIGQLVEHLKKPYAICGSGYEIAASVGYCLYPYGKNDLASILKKADSRMYENKRERRGSASRNGSLPSGDSGILERSPMESRSGIAVYDGTGNLIARSTRWEEERWGEESGCPAGGQEVLAFSVPEGSSGPFRVLISGENPQEAQECSDCSDADSMDKLTGLHDRTSFYEKFFRAVTDQIPLQDGCLLLLVMDLDRFQVTNDISGHTMGDRVLKAVSERLLKIVRKNDLVARLGGDEFALAFSGIQSRKAAEKVASEILQSLSMPYTIEGQEYFLTASIGATIMPEDGQDFETLISNADMALSQSKEQGRFQVQFFSAEARARQTVRYSMEKKLYKALERNEFRLYYQPMIDMVTGRTSGAEALIRWISEDGSLVPPDQFIPLAEENGMIIPIGQWVVRTALEELSVWRRCGLDHLRISINLSARQLQEPDFLSNFLQMLSHSGENPENIMIEMTETVVMQKAQESIDLLGALKANRIRIAIDDFGTGYSSLSYLRRFPVDVLKIDRSFVRQIGAMGEDSEIVRLISLLARALSLEVCAEGVETELELSYLKEFGVGSYQGYLASPAIPSDCFVRWAQQSRSGFLSQEMQTGSS